MAHRQFVAWQHWLAIDRNRPSRSDWYQMQTAAEVRVTRFSFAEKPPSVNLDDFKLNWEDKAEEKQKRKYRKIPLPDEVRNDSVANGKKDDGGWKKSRAVMASILQVELPGEIRDEK